MILIDIILISLGITGLFLSTQADMILHRPARFIEKLLTVKYTKSIRIDGGGYETRTFTKPHWLYAPLIGCVTCMASLWSVVFWLVFGSFNPLWLLVVIPAVAGLTTLIYGLIPDEE